MESLVELVAARVAQDDLDSPLLATGDEFLQGLFRVLIAPGGMIDPRKGHNPVAFRFFFLCCLDGPVVVAQLHIRDRDEGVAEGEVRTQFQGFLETGSRLQVLS